MKTKIIIAGAGAAGLACAWELSRNGAEVLLLDRRVPPRSKPCGGGLTPRALKLLRNLGLKLDTGSPVFSLEGNAPPWHYNRFEFKKPTMHLVRRDLFNRSLLQAAASAGARIQEARVLGASHGPSGFLVKTQGDTFSADYLVAADGPASRVRKSLGARAPFLARAVMIDEVKGPRVPNRVIFDGDPAGFGYGWVFPYGDGSANAGVYSLFSGEKGAMRSRLHQYLADRLGVSSSDYRITGGLCPWGGYDLPASVPVLLTGDAGGFVDPMTGEGIYHAVYTGVMAARAILAAPDPRKVRGVYEKNIRGLLLNSRLLRLIAPLAYRFPRQGGLLLKPRLIHGPVAEGLIRGMNTSKVGLFLPGLLLASIFDSCIQRFTHQAHSPLDRQ